MTDTAATARPTQIIAFISSTGTYHAAATCGTRGRVLAHPVVTVDGDDMPACRHCAAGDGFTTATRQTALDAANAYLRQLARVHPRDRARAAAINARDRMFADLDS